MRPCCAASLHSFRSGAQANCQVLCRSLTGAPRRSRKKIGSNKRRERTVWNERATDMFASSAKRCEPSQRTFRRLPFRHCAPRGKPMRSRAVATPMKTGCAVHDCRRRCRADLGRIRKQPLTGPFKATSGSPSNNLAVKVFRVGEHRM